MRDVKLSVLLRAFVEGEVAVQRREVDHLGGWLRDGFVHADLMSGRDFGKSNDVRRDVHGAGRAAKLAGRAK